MLLITKQLHADINECLTRTNNSGCAQICNNTAGFYRCSCNHGYELTSDNHTCTGMWIPSTYVIMTAMALCFMLHSDISECLGTHDCSQLCVELEGRHECRCFDGYELADDHITCEGIYSYVYNLLVT